MKRQIVPRQRVVYRHPKFEAFVQQGAPAGLLLQDGSGFPLVPFPQLYFGMTSNLGVSAASKWSGKACWGVF